MLLTLDLIDNLQTLLKQLNTKTKEHMQELLLLPHGGIYYIL